MKFEKIAEKIHCAANMDYSFYCNSCILHTRMNSQKASNDLVYIVRNIEKNAHQQLLYLSLQTDNYVVHGNRIRNHGMKICFSVALRSKGCVAIR